jgi:hypothetical protein
MDAQAQAYASLNEDDSFGPLTRYVVCLDCYTQHIEDHNNQKTCCQDCKQLKLNRDMRQWKWYDFYAAQGDEPMDICNECWTQPKHVNRMAKDKADYRAEMASYDDQDDDYYTDSYRYCP